VTARDGQRFYLEAACVTGETALERGRRRLWEVVLDEINKTNSPDFFFGFERKGVLTSSPPVRLWRKRIEDWLRGLDHAEITRLGVAGKIDELPSLRLVHEGWSLVITPIPKKEEARGRADIRPSGVWSLGFRWNRSVDQFRTTILKKAGKHGLLRLPYVVAVHVDGMLVDDKDAMDALYGQICSIYHHNPDGTFAVRTDRKPDGALTSHAGPRYRNVSAVLMVRGFSPPQVEGAELGLFHNPWARARYTSALCVFRSLVSVPESARLRFSWRYSQTSENRSSHSTPSALSDRDAWGED
jgi:hypothetical protein